MLRNNTNSLIARASAELREFGALVRAPWFWAALGIGLLLWALAYQIAPRYLLAIGGDREARLRGFDTPFLTGFNDSEPADRPELPWHAGDTLPYRWASDRANVTLPGAGGDLWVLRVSAASGRPDGSAVESVWQVGDGPALALRIEPQPRTYAILGAADAADDLQLTVVTEPLAAANDPRTLGLVMFRVVAEPSSAGLYRPSGGALGLLALTLAGVYALIRRTLSFEDRRDIVAFAGALVLAALAAWMLGARRLDLTAFIPVFAALIWCAYLLAVLLMMPLHHTGYADAPAAAGLAAGAFVARMAGMLHPYALTSDLGLHVNNLAGVARGALFFTEGLPCRAGAGPQPYPPGGYLALLPGTLLTGADREALTLLARGGTALLESLTTALLWLLLRRAGMGRRAALAAGALYMLAPPLLRSYSVGEMANLLGQALVAPVLLWLILAAQNHSRRMAAAGAALLALVLLSHSGITLSVGALLAVWLPLHVLAHMRGDSSWRAGLLRSWPHMLAIGAAGIVALALFYSAFGYIAEARQVAQQELSAQGIICPPGDPLLSKLNWWVAGLVLSANAPVAPVILAAGAAGAALAIAGRKQSLRLMLAAVWLGVIVSLGTLVISDQPVRWTLFLYPALCLGAGIALSAWSRRGRAGGALAVVIVAYLLWYGSADWVRQVSEYLR